MAFISSKAFNTPPKPASASATMGVKKSNFGSPLELIHSIWSALLKELLILFTREGTESTGYRD